MKDLSAQSFFSRGLHVRGNDVDRVTQSCMIRRGRDLPTESEMR